MYCKNCGEEIDDKAVICPKCGCQVKSSLSATVDGIQDTGSIGWGVLGCCAPLIGLILYLVWKDTKPKTAKMAGKGALVCVVLAVIYYVIAFIFGLALALS